MNTRMHRAGDSVMGDYITVTVSLNQQQLQMVTRLVGELLYGESPAAVIRRILVLYAARHPELFLDDPAR